MKLYNGLKNKYMEDKYLIETYLSRRAHQEICPDSLWGIERFSDKPERMIFIYEALVKLGLPDNFSIIDIAAGRGVVLNGVAGIFPNCDASILDVVAYPYDWAKIPRRVKRYVMPLQKFIKKSDKVYDVVMMLNSYRNWNADRSGLARKDFNHWLESNAKYFITSGVKLGVKLPYETGEIRGWDYKGKLQLFKLPLSKK